MKPMKESVDMGQYFFGKNNTEALKDNCFSGCEFDHVSHLIASFTSWKNLKPGQIIYFTMYPLHTYTLEIKISKCLISYL